MNCIVCNKEGIAIKKILKYTIYKCRECGLEFTSPFPTGRELSDFYQNYIDFRAEDSVLEKNAHQNITALSKYGLSQKSQLLDYGCGKNIFVKRGNSSNWFGYDKYFSSKKVDFKIKKWDFITMWGVLEHLTSPKIVTNDLVSSLNKEGKLVLTTVSTELNIPFQYKPIEHLTYWTEKAIRELFKLVGLKILEYRPYQMYQKSTVYIDIILRTVPPEIKSKIYHNLPEYIFVPTNEIFVVGQKC